MLSRIHNMSRNDAAHVGPIINWLALAFFGVITSRQKNQRAFSCEKEKGRRRQTERNRVGGKPANLPCIEEVEFATRHAVEPFTGANNYDIYLRCK
jgi:hypothetical protein